MYAKVICSYVGGYCYRYIITGSLQLDKFSIVMAVTVLFILVAVDYNIFINLRYTRTSAIVRKQLSHIDLPIYIC
jgi:hypothetical protein